MHYAYGPTKVHKTTSHILTVVRKKCFSYSWVIVTMCMLLDPFAVRSKVWVCDRSVVGIAGSNPAAVFDVCRECCVLSG